MPRTGARARINTFRDDARTARGCGREQAKRNPWESVRSKGPIRTRISYNYKSVRKSARRKLARQERPKETPTEARDRSEIMAETGGGRAHRCGDCAGCRRRNDGGCGRCLMCLKKRHGSDAQGRQSCALHWCSQMRAYDDKGPVQGLTGWSVIAIPRVADGEDYYYLSPEGGRLRSRHEVLIHLKMGPTPPPPGWNWDAPPLPARPTPAAPRARSSRRCARRASSGGRGSTRASSQAAARCSPTAAT